MAIIFACNVMVVRKSEIDGKCRGGMTRFRSDCMVKPGRWREDDHLLVSSSMGGDFKEVAERLKSLGVDVLITDESVPPVENVKGCGWIEWDV
jgi:hypothetical protein